jgi:hypothetical protein
MVSNSARTGMIISMVVVLRLSRFWADTFLFLVYYPEYTNVTNATKSSHNWGAVHSASIIGHQPARLTLPFHRRPGLLRTPGIIVKYIDKLTVFVILLKESQEMDLLISASTPR